VKTWIDEFPKLQFDVRKDINGGDPAAGLNRVNQFGTVFGESKIQNLKTELEGLRGTLSREAVTLGSRRYAEARPLLAERKRAEARKIMEETRPRIKGFPAAEKQLDQHLNEFK